MTNSSDADRDGSGPPGPRWPLDLLSSWAAEHCQFVRPRSPGAPLGADLDELLLTASPRQARAHGLALVQALRAADFLGTVGAGDDEQDVYAATQAGRRLQVGLSPYVFPGQPVIVLIEITALPDGSEPAPAARR